MLKNYERLKFKLTHIPQGEKGPVHEGWSEKPTSYKKLYNGYADHNVGLLHSLSRTCCLDIDNLELACKIPGFEKLLKKGLRYSSGKPNRLKSVFRIPEKHDIGIFRTHTIQYKGETIGQFRCCSSNGTSVQDVLPPSLHPEGYKYEWIDDVPRDFKDIPPLPKALIKHAKLRNKTRKTNEARYRSAGLAFYVKIYNDWFHNKGYSLENEVLKTGGYADIGLGRFKRVGSSNKQAIIIYSDEHGQFGVNYSDTQGDNYIKYGAFDPYDMLVHNKFRGNEKAARYYVTNENSKLKKLCDEAKDYEGLAEIGIAEEVKLIRRENIKFDEKGGFPYLSMELMIPGSGPDGEAVGGENKDKGNFSRIVESVLFHQEGVYNPDMAFWYSVVLLDYLCGSGYFSVNSNRTAPLYVFTAGDSSDGKSSTIQSGEKHLLSIGGQGNATVEEARMSVGDKNEKAVTPVFTTDFLNKKHIKNVGSAQGLEDLITTELDHGCDILFTQDEYGLSDKGTIDQAGKAMRSLLLSYRTLSRWEAVEPRALVQSQQNKSAKRNSTYCVHFNYFTAATNETLKGVIKDSEVGMGYIQRFIGGIARSTYFSARMRKLGSATTSKGIAKDVKRILRNIVERSNRIVGYDRTKKGYPIDITEDALAYLQELSNLCIESRNVRVKKLVENIQPLCRVRAVADNPKRPVVDIETVRWAHSVASCSILYFDWLLNELNKTEITLEKRMENKIIRYMIKVGAIKETKALTRGQIINGSNIHKMGSSHDYKPVWEGVVAMGILRDKAIGKKVIYWLNKNGPGVAEMMEE